MRDKPARLHVAFTMDCERVAAHSPPGGPETWEISERAIRGYCDRLLDAGFAPTLFCVPECAEYHTDMLLDYATRGVELGLHVHPRSFRGGDWTGYLAEYDRAMQRHIIAEELAATAAALRQRPTSFRAGNLSASDETFSVLVELGFQQGSNSIPGRNAPHFAAVWEGACPDAHWADEHSRLRPGTLPFLEVPITTDPSRRTPEGSPYELRIEHGTFEDYHRRTLESAIEDVDRRGASFLSICILTHNFFDYSDGQEVMTSTLDGFINYLRGMNTRDVVAVTMTEAREAFEASSR